MRFLRHGEITWSVGEIVSDRDGVVQGPNGEELRQIVTDECFYASSTWISKEGTCYQRVRNPNSDWIFNFKSCNVDHSGSLVIQIGGAGKFRTIKLIRAIALAWIDCPRLPFKLQAFLKENSPLCAENIFWAKQGTSNTLFETNNIINLVYPLDDDEWTVLKYTWRYPSGDPIFVFDSTKHGNYTISRRGWIKTPNLSVTKGHRSPTGRMWFGISNECAIWIDAAVLESFEGPCTRRCKVEHLNEDASDNVLENIRWKFDPIEIPKSLSDITDLLTEKDFNAKMACETLNITRQILWSRLHQLSCLLPIDFSKKYLKRCIAKVVHNYFFENNERAFLPFNQINLEELYQETLYDSMEKEDKYGMCLLARELHSRSQWIP